MGNRFYTGVGSRSTPIEVCALMSLTASILEGFGFILRSGGAEGADIAFERGARDSRNKEIFYAGDSTTQAEKIAEKIHPNWAACTPLARKLHGRNVFQVLGKDLISPSEFLICWTKDAEKVGGTRTAIVLAESYRIPVFNLGDPNRLASLDEFLFSLKGNTCTTKSG